LAGISWAVGKRGAPGFFLGGGMLLGGWMRQRTRLGKRRREFWRAATHILAGGRRHVRACVMVGVFGRGGLAASQLQNIPKT